MAGLRGLFYSIAGASMRHVDLLVAITSLSLWAFLFVACLLVYARSCHCLRPGLYSDTIYRLYATWRDCLRLFTVFWFAFFCHWVLDLGSTIGFLVVAYQRDVTHPSNEACLEHGLELGCTLPVNLILVTVTVGLCLFKLIAACEYLRFSILPQAHLTHPLRRALRNV